MALNDDAKNSMLDHIGTEILYISLHTDVLGSGSGNEVTGGTPAYARKAPAWAAADTGSMAMSNDPVFDIPPSTTVRRAGFFGHLTNATPYYGDGELVDESYTGQGTYTLTAATLSITG
jgi:hypothetical protein